MRVDILRLILFNAGDFDLLETPLREIDVAGAEVAAQRGVFEAEGGGQGADFGVVPRCSVVDDFDRPVVFLVAHCCVAVTGDFVIAFGNRGGRNVGMEVAAGLRVD